MTLREALIAAESRLAAAGCDSPALDARVLLGHVLGVDEAAMIAHDSDPLGQAEAPFEALVRRRVAREPVAYLTGRKEFYSLSFDVGPAVLVPRPETELLVDAALEFLRSRAGSQTVVDVGTGTGAIAITLAREMRERGEISVLAVDRSEEALAVARTNADRLVATNVEPDLRFARGNLTTALPASAIDLVVSNPPYLTRAELENAPPELGFEPSLALAGGSDDGLGVVRELLAEAVRVLRPGGRLLCEIGARQEKVAKEIAQGLGFTRVEVLRDLAGRPRMLRADARGERRSRNTVAPTSGDGRG